MTDETNEANESEESKPEHDPIPLGPKAPPTHKVESASRDIKATGKRTPIDWCNFLGRFTLGPRIGNRTRARRPVWQHASAGALHGWTQHAHDEGAPIKLSQKDYEAALSAVEKHPLMPHKPALSKHCRHDFSKHTKD